MIGMSDFGLVQIIDNEYVRLWLIQYPKFAQCVEDREVL